MSVSRKQIKAERRRRRMAAEQAQVVDQRAQQRRRYTVLAAAVAGLIVLVSAVALLAFLSSDRETLSRNADTGRRGGDTTSVGFPDQGNAHIQSVGQSHPPYNSDPPTSGWHLSNLAQGGWHDEPVPKELVLHNLEDGYVAIQYRPNLDPAQKQQLQALVEDLGSRVIAVPYEGLDAPIVLTAWTRMDKLENGFDEERIRTFVDAYRGIDHHKRS